MSRHRSPLFHHRQPSRMVCSLLLLSTVIILSIKEDLQKGSSVQAFVITTTTSLHNTKFGNHQLYYRPPPSSAGRSNNQQQHVLRGVLNTKFRLHATSTSSTSSSSSSSGLIPENSSEDEDKEEEKGQGDEKDKHDDMEMMSYSVAIRNTILSIAVAVIFGAGIGYFVDPIVAEEYFAGYIVEKSLSVDNLFVFLLLFDYFDVPTQYQPKVLNWGIYGSIIMRSIMITLGAAALQHFHFILLIFAGILIYSAVQVLIDVEEYEEDIANNPVVQLSRFICESVNEECDIDEFDQDLVVGQEESVLETSTTELVDDATLLPVTKKPNPVIIFSRSIFPSTKEYDGDNFFTEIYDEKKMEMVKKATPLFVCMVAVELSDVIFAVDSIPAVFGVTDVSFTFSSFVN